MVQPMVPYAIMFHFFLVPRSNDVQLKSHMQWHSCIIKVFSDSCEPLFPHPRISNVFSLVSRQSFSPFLPSESVWSLRITRADRVMFTGSGVKSLLRDLSPSKEMILPSFPSTPSCNLMLFSALFPLHLTERSLHRLVLRSVLRPDNIDSWAWVTKSSKSVLFLPESSSLYTSPYTVSSGQLSLSLSSSISLFSFSLQSLIFCPPPPPLPAFSELLVLGEFLRGIFPALDYQYGP